MRAEHYREEAARFQSLAEMEPITVLRRHLAARARQYEQIAADLEPSGQGLAVPSPKHTW
jgi:hypothetical protein